MTTGLIVHVQEMDQGSPRLILEYPPNHPQAYRGYALPADTGVIGVRIGREHKHAGLTETAVVASGYGGEGEVVARLGVLGPTRMDYPGAMGAVQAVARYVGQILLEG